MSEPLPFRVRLQIALREVDLSWSAKYMGLFVVSYMNDEGEAWPTLERLAHEASLAKGTVRKGLAELEAIDFFVKRSSRKGNHYYPQMTPDLDRLVEQFLERAARRRGQLPLPLDGRGRTLTSGSRGDLRGSHGDLEVDREVDREVEKKDKTGENATSGGSAGLSEDFSLSKIGDGIASRLQSSSVPSDSFALLLGALHDSKANTEQVLCDLLERLPPHAAQRVRDELFAAYSRTEVRSPTRYVVGILQNWIREKGMAA